MNQTPIEQLEAKMLEAIGLIELDDPSMSIYGTFDAATACAQIAVEFGKVEKVEFAIEMLEGMKFKPGTSRDATLINTIIEHQITELKQLLK